VRPPTDAVAAGGGGGGWRRVRTSVSLTVGAGALPWHGDRRRTRSQNQALRKA
jgi:hypothetical protein